MAELRCSLLKFVHVHSTALTSGTPFVDSDAIQTNSTNWPSMELTNAASSSVALSQFTVLLTCLLDHVITFSHKLFFTVKYLATPPTCDITNRFYDIVVLIDGSASSNFSVLQNLMISTFSQYTLNANTTRLSTVVINGNATLVNYLKDSDGKNAQQVIGSATTDNSAGQNMATALQLISSEHQNNVTSGYRSDPRHLVVYVTSNTNFTGGDPGDYLLALRRGGIFGFIAVGYNLNSADANTLVNFSGDLCTYSDSTQNAATNIANFVQDITCFRFPVCGEA